MMKLERRHMNRTVNSCGACAGYGMLVKEIPGRSKALFESLGRQDHDGLNLNCLSRLVSIVLSVVPSKREACSSPCHERILSFASSRLMIFVVEEKVVKIIQPKMGSSKWLIEFKSDQPKMWLIGR
ncbi:Uncharacterized protein Rs2_04805 [Raphanus sativus]|nr:Uncharacterized protein Rs2_04805 [Raphanus sativus]